MYGNIIFNSDALNVLLKDLLVFVLVNLLGVVIVLLVAHIIFSFVASLMGIVVGIKTTALFRERDNYNGTTDWFAIYMGISMWTWISIVIGAIIILAVKLLFVYGVLRIQ